MKHFKELRKNAIVLVLILLLILYLILKDNFLVIVTTIMNSNIWWILVAILFVFVYYICKSICLHLIVKEYKDNIKFKDIFKLTLVTQFFNGITPFSSGGQPMEVYYLNKVGVKVANGTNAIAIDFVLYQMALIVNGLLAIFLNYKYHFFASNSLLRKLTLVGFIINTLVGVGLLFICFSSWFNKWVLNIIVKISHKLGFIKDKDKFTSKWINNLNEFHDSAKLLVKNKSLFIKGFIYNFVGLLAFYVVPFFVFLALGNNSINAVEAITASAYVLVIGAFVPIPGGSGGIEYGFLQFFGNFVSGGLLSAGLLIWRFVTYYLGIIIGAVMIGFIKGDDKK